MLFKGNRYGWKKEICIVYHANYIAQFPGDHLCGERAFGIAD